VSIGNFKLTYDLEQLIRRASAYSYDEEYGDEYEINENECGSQYRMTKEDFDSARDSFVREIASLTEERVIELFKSNARVTKKGTLDARMRHILVSSDITINYYNEYGSHSYDVPSVQILRNSETDLELMVTEVSHQDSF
jgi:hypothetical protein